MHSRVKFQIGNWTVWLVAFWLGCVAIPTSLFGQSRTGTASTNVAPVTSPWQRIAIIGASASAGFMLSEPLGGTNSQKLRLDRYLEAALRLPHDPILNFASALFFMQPETQGRTQVERALQSRPMLVVAPDFLFWFCYGQGASDQERLKRFEFGLKLLESIPCAMVVGDIPDCSAAANGILDPLEIPSPNAIQAANARLKAWASSDPRISVAPLSSFMRTAIANKLITIHDQTLSAGESRRLLQADRLHPTPLGATVLTLTLLEAAREVAAKVSTNDICWNYKEVLRVGFAGKDGVSTNRVEIARPVSEPAVSNHLR
jgi:hypothetical protein